MGNHDDKLYSDFDYDSALSVQAGVGSPSQVNNAYLEQVRARRQQPVNVEELASGIRHGNRTMLSRAITLVESTRHEHQRLAQAVIEQCLPYSGRSIRVGITGVPGAGKSTLIEALGKHLTEHGHRVAVLAIDPSSARSRGSILGDKTRMEALSTDPNAFIRPSPSAGSLGGVARKTREIITLCEAANFDIVIVETVGVGQSEVAAHAMVDFFLLLQLANTGDELQGIKRGIMEMADMIAINKCELDPMRAELAAAQFRNALHLFPMPDSQWATRVMLCSAYTHQGVEELWNNIMEYVTFTRENGYFYKKRQEQNLRILQEAIENGLRDRFYNAPGMEEKIETAKRQIWDNQISAYQAADALLGSME